MILSLLKILPSHHECPLPSFSLYCWRTRRMLAERDLSTFDVMLDGDLGKGLRKFKNLPEPVPKPEQPEEEEEEEPEAGEEIIGRPPVAKPPSQSESMDVEDGEEDEEQDGKSADVKSSEEELEEGEEGEANEGGEDGEANEGDEEGEATEEGEEMAEAPTASITEETDDVLAGISYDAEEQGEAMAVSEDNVDADNNDLLSSEETTEKVEGDPVQLADDIAANVDEKIAVDDGTMEE